MYDSILVPVDGSDPADAATEEATTLARRFDATLSLLSVVDTSRVPVAGSVPEDPGREALDDETERALDRAEARAAEHGVPCRTAVEPGVPHEEIRTRAADADLVSMGTHGRTGLQRHLLGSVTERVLRSVETPVVTTRATDEREPVDRVLVPTDGSAPAERAADHAVAIADRFDATVHVVSVVNTRALAAAYETGGGLPEFVDSLVRDRERQVGEMRDEVADRGVDCETAVLEASPARAIREYVDDNGVDLVSMGTHGRSGLDRLLLGSVAERTVRTSDVPVLTVPAESE